MNRSRFINSILFFGDAAAFFLALLVTLALRGRTPLEMQFIQHIAPFSLLLIVWQAVFFINDFYSRHRWRLTTDFFRAFFVSLSINGFFSVVFFYLFEGTFAISPKTVLALHFVAFAFLFVGWRALIQQLLSVAALQKSVLFIEPRDHTLDLVRHMHRHRTTPFRVAGVLHTRTDVDLPDSLRIHYRDTGRLQALVAKHNVEILVVEKHGLERVRLHSELLAAVRVVDPITFWEEVFEEIPIDRADKAWFIGQFHYTRRRVYAFSKRLIDIVVALFLSGVLCWMVAPIAIGIKWSSPGPVFFRQRRVGKNGREFTVVKFRTMVEDAEPSGPQWARKEDARVTSFGRFLRHTHLDEFPQLWNILKGEMSFVGPRPERPVFVNAFKAEIPFYNLRHLVSPGLTGWAQINYPYGRSKRDTLKKLAYDLYYVKHRSLLFDANILLKTVGFLFWREKTHEK